MKFPIARLVRLLRLPMLVAFGALAASCSDEPSVHLTALASVDGVSVTFDRNVRVEKLLTQVSINASTADGSQSISIIVDFERGSAPITCTTGGHIAARVQYVEDGVAYNLDPADVSDCHVTVSDTLNDGDDALDLYFSATLRAPGSVVQITNGAVFAYGIR
jgi:hypothetical protein